MSRRVIVGYEWNRADGDCVELTVLGGDPDEKFLIPFDQVEDVSSATLSLLSDVQKDNP